MFILIMLLYIIFVGQIPKYGYMTVIRFTRPYILLPIGLQVIFPDYLQEKFVQSALSYIMCNGEGKYVCRDSQCICQCDEEFPQCNCPITDIQIMENSLHGMMDTWANTYKDFENSGKILAVLAQTS